MTLANQILNRAVATAAVATKMTPPHYESFLQMLHEYQEVATAIGEIVDNSEEHGARNINVSWTEGETSGLYNLIVADDGVGMSEESLTAFWTFKQQKHVTGATGAYGMGGKSASNYLGSLKDLMMVSFDGEKYRASRALDNEFGYETLPEEHAKALYEQYSVDPTSTGTIYILRNIHRDLIAEEKAVEKFFSLAFAEVIKRGVNIRLNGKKIEAREMFTGNIYAGCKPEYTIPINDLVPGKNLCPDVRCTMRIMEAKEGHSKTIITRGTSKRGVVVYGGKAAGVHNATTPVATRVTWHIHYEGPADQMRYVDKAFGIQASKEFKSQFDRPIVNWLNQSPLGDLLKKLATDNSRGLLAKERDFSEIEKELGKDVYLHDLRKKKTIVNFLAGTSRTNQPASSRTPSQPKSDIKIEPVYQGLNCRQYDYQLETDGTIIIYLNFSFDGLKQMSNEELLQFLRHEIVPKVGFREGELPKVSGGSELTMAAMAIDTLENEYRANVDYDDLRWDSAKGKKIIERLANQEREMETSEAIALAKKMFPATWAIKGKKASADQIRSNFLNPKFVKNNCPGITLNSTKTGGKVKIKCTRQ